MSFARYLGIGAVFIGLAVAAAPGCSSDDNTNTGGSGGSTGGAGGSTGGAGGSTGGAGGATGGSSGSVTPAFKAMNPCPMESAYMKDMTTITAGPALSFSPKCLQVKKGTKVSFTVSGGGMFGPTGAHTVAPSTTRTDPGNPIPAGKTGSTIDVTFDKSGFFGYFCPTHDANDADSASTTTMNGVVWVTD
jgi:plastocyanin